MYNTTQPPYDLMATGGNFMSDGMGTAFHQIDRRRKQWRLCMEWAKRKCLLSKSHYFGNRKHHAEFMGIDTTLLWKHSMMVFIISICT